MMTVTEQSIETEPKAEPKFRLQLPWAAWRGMWFFPAAVLWMELVLRIATIGFDYPKGLLYTFGFSLAAGLLLALLGKAFSPKVGRIVVTVLWAVFSVFYMGQVVYYAIFKVYFTLFSVGGAGQVAQFSGVIFGTILRCWWALLLMLVPLALLIWQGKQRIEWGHTRWKELLAPLIAALLLQMLTTACILPDTGGAMSASRLYTTDFISNLSVSRFGLLTTFRIEARNAIFGPMPAVGGRTEPEPEP